MKKKFRPGWMYILLCEGGKYYTGSTVDLKRRMDQHWAGKGANFTRKNPPLKLVYTEYFLHVAAAFEREKQIQGWSHKKKTALMRGDIKRLKELAQCQNDTKSVKEYSSRYWSQ